MAYYALGSIGDAGIVNEESYVTAFGQVLNGIDHLHARGVVHRDLKPENFLVETKPFKIIITDFGLAKVTTDNALLTTFCGSLKYAAPEVFPGVSRGHGPLADVWSLGVIVFEWIYGIPPPPTTPTAKRNEKSVPEKRYRGWIDMWADLLRRKLADQEEDQVVELLTHMIEWEVSERWYANGCLAQGFTYGLFKRRVADGLVVCASGQDANLPRAERTGDGTKASTATSMSSAGNDPEATFILGKMWGGGSANSSGL